MTTPQKLPQLLRSLTGSGFDTHYGLSTTTTSAGATATTTTTMASLVVQWLMNRDYIAAAWPHFDL